MSANSAGQAFDLRCEVREKMIDFLQREHPEALPTSRQINVRSDGAAARQRPDAMTEPSRRVAGGL